jgi:RNA polymerase sigma-70 factor (ECF subfamily)
MDELTRVAHAARLGDERAMEDFVKASYADVWRLCGALVDQASAEDLAQETFLRATRGLRRFHGRASARTWLFSIARCTCMDELRRRYRQTRRDRELVASADGAPTSPDPLGQVALHELLGHIDRDRRAAFVLTQLFRLSYEETAVVCDCPAGTVRSRVARARDDLIKLLAQSQAPRQVPQR